MNERQIKDGPDRGTLYERWKRKLLNKPTVVIGLLLFALMTGSLQFAKEIKSLFYKKAPGRLQISAVRVVPNRLSNNCLVDFRIINVGETVVLVNQVEFELLDIVSVDIKGPLGFSMVYDLDISGLEKIGDKIFLDVSQEIKPNEADRFGIRLTAQKIPSGIERGWRLIPRIVTSAGTFEGDRIEIWFPYDGQGGPGYFEESKKIADSAEAMKKKYGIKKRSKKRDEKIPRPIFKDPEAEKIFDELIAENDLSKMAKMLMDISFYKEKIGRKIVESEMFGKNFQQKIIAESNTKKVALCLEPICRLSDKGGNAILGYRDFGLRVFPQKLNDEQDIENIGLLLMIIASCRPRTVNFIVEESRGLIDIKNLIQKINNEPDIKKIGKCVFRINYANTYFAKALVESEYFDKKNLIQKINSEPDIEKINDCLGGIADASKDVAKSIYISLKPEIQNKLKQWEKYLSNYIIR